MKSITEFLSSPGVNLFAGLLLYLLLGCAIFNYDAFDRMSAFYGGLFLIAMDLFSYGFDGLFAKRKDKKSPQDLDDEN